MACSYDFVLALAEQLERLLGKEVMPLMLKKIQEELGVDDVWRAAAQRPYVFEQAIQKILGDAGIEILHMAYNEAMAKMEKEGKLQRYGRMHDDR
jgi:hypothetical protein